jgi:hypothetical protein
LPRSVKDLYCRRQQVGLTPGTGANILFRAESRPAGLQAQQAQKPAVGTSDSGPPSPGRDHRSAHFSKVGSRRHRAACESPQRRSGSIKSLAPGDVVTFHDSLQASGRADDQRGMDMIVAEEVPYLTDGGRRRMSCGSREHHLGSGAQDLIHRSRIRTAYRTRSPTVAGLGGMMAWAGRRLWLAAWMAIRTVKMAHDEQVSMWECILLTSGAAPLAAAGPLRWVASLGGYRLAGSHLPAQDLSETGR